MTLKGGETLTADFVVDAAGKLSRVQQWLSDGGYDTPRAVEVDANIGYSGGIFSVPDEVCLLARLLRAYAVLQAQAHPDPWSVLRTRTQTFMLTTSFL